MGKPLMMDKVIDLRPNLNSIEADRMLIEQTASYIKGLWQQVNAAEIYITAGREFKNLHGHLSKNSPKDKTRIGWKRAFNKIENKFGCSYKTADNYILVFEAFSTKGNAFPSWKLPQSLRALLVLAKLKLTADQLKQAAADGVLNPNSTENDVRKIALQLGLIIAKKKKTKTQPVPLMPSKSAPKKDRIAAVFDVLARLGLTVDDLEGEF